MSTRPRKIPMIARKSSGRCFPRRRTPHRSPSKSESEFESDSESQVTGNVDSYGNGPQLSSPHHHYPSDLELPSSNSSSSSRIQAPLSTQMHDSSSLKITIRPIAESTKRKTDVDLELLTAAKRGKPDSLVFTQHPVYWSSEKMVIFQVQNTLFRLHERHLGLHSPFFASLFAGNHPRQSEYLAHIDGQNVYRISSTSVEDFETLLSALDNMVKYTHSPPAFSIIASILRVSTNLQFPSFREFAVKYFQTMWPDNLDAMTAKHLPCALETIALARECNVPGPLKRAFYELLRMPEFLLAEIIQGKDSKSVESTTARQSEEFGSLSSADVRRLHHARNRLILSWTAATISPPSSFTYSDHPLTDAHTAIWYNAVLKSGMFQDYLYDPICGLDEVLLGINWDEEVDGWSPCENCRKGRREAWLKQKVELWENLDAWLEL